METRIKPKEIEAPECIDEDWYSIWIGKCCMNFTWDGLLELKRVIDNFIIELAEEDDC